MEEVLICLEESCVARRATNDSVILGDDRVLENLLLAEDREQRPSLDYLTTQSDIQPHMRKMVTTWLLEVCEEQQREDEVFPLAVNYLDRVLSSSATRIRKTQLQLLATSCLLIASKMKETEPLDGDKLVMYTDHSITLDELLDMEITVLTVLRWDTSAITPHDFLHLLLVRLRVPERHHRSVMRHSSTFIAMCAIDVHLAVISPSIVASACLVASIKGLVSGPSDQHIRLFERLQEIANIDAEYIATCVAQIELALSNNFPSSDSSSPSEEQTNSSHSSSPSPSSLTTPVNQKPIDPTQPSTPSDVREIVLST